MDNKYVLILGAGLMQRPSIEAARELGYRTLVVDANPSALCATFADRFEPVDLKDAEGIARLAQSLDGRIAGVFTAGTDFSASVSYVAERCGFPAHSYEAALNASNKLRMRECFRAAGVGSPGFQPVERSQITAFLRPEVLGAMTFPKVVKPVDNMGARGCRLVRGTQEFLPAIEEAVRNSLSGRVILEDYMEGPEFSIDALVWNGTFTVTGFADRHICYPPYFIEMGHTMPSSVDERTRLELILAFARGAKALGLTCGAAKADIKYTKDGPMIGEIAARLSGGYMSGWTYPYASGLNLTKQAMLVAVGQEPRELLLRRRPLPIRDSPYGIYEVPCQQTAAERAWISIPGTVEAIYGGDQTEAYPFVKNVLFRNRRFSAVTFPRNNVEKCGNCIAVASSRELAVEGAENAVAEIVLRLAPHNPLTDDFLSGRELRHEERFPESAYVLDRQQRDALRAYLAGAGTLRADAPVLPRVPPCLSSVLYTAKDWNHRSMAQALAQFDRICPRHPELEEREFWNAFVRGGLQGILYVSDCRGGGEERRR